MNGEVEFVIRGNRFHDQIGFEKSEDTHEYMRISRLLREGDNDEDIS